MAVIEPRPRNVSQIKSSLLSPALTSHYDLNISIPNNTAFSDTLKFNKINFLQIQNNLQLSCCEATLPGSSLATHEINNDYTGVTERHAYRRIYDDRIDLTFYVDTNYTVIRFFECWIKFIVSESISGGRDNNPAGLISPNYFYTVKYPKEYQSQFSVIKYERDYKRKLVYTFLKAYPLSISSMPVSYDSSSLLKCTVSFSYSRYYIENLPGFPPPEGDNPQSTLNSPSTQAQINSLPFNDLINVDFGVNTTGGVSAQAAQASGNSVQVFEGDEIIGAVNANQTPVESGLPYVGRNIGPLAP